jgi:hypothetical protein
MKLHFYVMFATFILATKTQAQTPEHYQLKIYSFETSAQMVNMDDYLKNAVIPKLKKSGIDYVGVFKPREENSATSNCTYVLIPFNSLKEFIVLNNTYVKEKQNLFKNFDYLNPSNTKTPYQKLEAVLIKADLDLPLNTNIELKSSKEDRVYELISYEATAEDLLKKREDLFPSEQIKEQLEGAKFDEIFYGEVLSDYDHANLMYMTSYNKVRQTPKTLTTNYTSRKEWRKLKRQQKRKLKRQLRNGGPTKIEDNTAQGPADKLREKNAVSNLLFAAEYSDF